MKTSSLISSRAGTAFMIACLSVIILFTACSKKNDPIPEPVGEARVRFVNALYGALAQDIYINGAKKGTTSLAYGATSENIIITSGVNTFNLSDAGTTVANASLQGRISIGDRYSFFYYKIADGTKVLASLPDAPSSPAAGKANVRFINLNSSLNAALTVSTVGVTDPTVPSLAYQGVSNFFPVDAGAKFTFSGLGVVVGAAFDGAIVAGKTYTIWIDGANATVLTGHIFEQN